MQIIPNTTGSYIVDVRFDSEEHDKPTLENLKLACRAIIGWEIDVETDDDGEIVIGKRPILAGDDDECSCCFIAEACRFIATPFGHSGISYECPSTGDTLHKTEDVMTVAIIEINRNRLELMKDEDGSSPAESEPVSTAEIESLLKELTESDAPKPVAVVSGQKQNIHVVEDNLTAKDVYDRISKAEQKAYGVNSDQELRAVKASIDAGRTAG